MALRTSALATLAAVAVLSACSGKDDPGTTSESDAPSSSGPSTSAPASPAAEAEAAVSGFYEDFAAGDLDAACDWWTDAYAAVSVADWNKHDYGPKVDDCPGLLSEITKVLAIVGDPAAQLEVTEVHGKLTGPGEALVDVTLAAAAEPETYQVSRTASGWLISGDRAGDLAPSDG